MVLSVAFWKHRFLANRMRWPAARPAAVRIECHSEFSLFHGRPEAFMATDLIPPRPEFSAILREQETYAAGESDDVGNRINSWFDLLMIQSGMGITRAWCWLCVCSVASLWVVWSS